MPLPPQRAAIRHVVLEWPIEDDIAALDEVLPGPCGWVALSGKEPKWENAVCLGAGRMTALATLRRRYRSAIERLPPADLVIYHQAIGTDLFGAEDAGALRVFWQHRPGLNRILSDRLARAVDVFWFDRELWRQSLRRSHSWIPDRRTRHLPLLFGAVPRKFPPIANGDPGRSSRPVYGWVGDLSLSESRVDRLEQLLPALKEAGFRGVVEVCGRPGPLEAALRRNLPPDQVVFLPHDEWAERIAAWTGLLLLGNEVRWTLPLIEALRNGLLVWMPAEEGGGADLPEALAYPAGELSQLARKLARLDDRTAAVMRSAAFQLYQTGRSVGNRQAATDALSAARDFSCRDRSRGQPRGLWPFGFYRYLQRTLHGKEV